MSDDLKKMDSNGKFVPGHPGGPGRPKGSPNKSTANAREAIARFVDGNAHKLQKWLDQIAADEKQGPKAAMACFIELLEYHVPKLARVEHTGDGGGPVRIIATPNDETL
mgnify:CR=1 FL=1